MTVRRLTVDDAPSYFALRRSSLMDAPLAFWSSPADDRASSLAAVEEMLAGEAPIFGAFDGDVLVGIVGLFRERHLKRRHKMGLWGMYVLPSHRRRGLGRALVREAIAFASAVEGVRWVMLGVTEAAPGARRLYEQLGFTIWGTEPEAVAHEGEGATEHHMALRLHID